MPTVVVELNDASGDHEPSSSSSLDTQHDSQSDDDNGHDQSAESMLQSSPTPLMRAPSSPPEKSPSPQVLQQTVDDVPIVRGPAERGFELNFVAETPQHVDQARSFHSGESKTAPSLNLDQGVHLSLQGLYPPAPPAPQAIWSSSCSVPVPPSLANRSNIPIFGIDNLQPTRAFVAGGGGAGNGSNPSYQFSAPNLPHDLRLDSLSHAHISSSTNRPTSQLGSQLDNGISGPPVNMSQWTNWHPQRAEDARLQGRGHQINGNCRSDGLPYSFEALLRTGYGGIADPLAHPPRANSQLSAHTWMIPPPTANAPRPNPPRPIMNSNYDPAYQAMGLPVDPHLRSFLAKYNRH